MNDNRPLIDRYEEALNEELRLKNVRAERFRVRLLVLALLAIAIAIGTKWGST